MTFSHGTQRVLFVAQIWEEQSVAFPLMVSFAVIVSTVLGQDA
jgi:hypothetical protein